jgi:hypothetical protein
MKTLLLLIILAMPLVAQTITTSAGAVTTGVTGWTRLPSTEATSLDLYSSYTEKIESVTLLGDKIEVVKRSTAYPSNIPAVYCSPTPCDWTIRRAWKEVYAVKDGKIVLECTIEAKILPATKESYEWPK